MGRGGAVLSLVLLPIHASSSAELPAAPARWFTDRVGVVSPEVARQVDALLESFEKEQGTQLLIVIEEKLPEGEVLETWTQRVAEHWGVGRSEEDDGAVLFVFVRDRALRLEVGYGLEGALTDLESQRLLDEVLVPRLRAGDWDRGVREAAEALIESVRGEYAGSSWKRRSPGERLWITLFLLALLVPVVWSFVREFRSLRRADSGRGPRSTGGPSSSGWPGGWHGGSFGGFGGSGGGGGFIGGGGSFGGGGASSRW